MEEVILNIKQAILLKNFFSMAYNKIIRKRNNAAKLIQRQFRVFLYHQEVKKYVKSRVILKIQRAWRSKNDNNYYSKSKQLKYESNSKKRVFTHAKTRQTIIPDILPPWGTKNKNKFSNEKIEEMLKERENSYKYFFRLAQGISTRYFNATDKINQIKEKNYQFMNRLLTTTFYLTTPFLACNAEGACQFFFHEPTYTLYAISKDSVISYIIGINEIETKEVKFPFPFPILDAAMDKRSGRIYILSLRWRIIVYEHGHIYPPKKIPINFEMGHKTKNISCDDFGYVWLYAAKEHCYILDPLSLSILREKVISIPGEGVFNYFVHLTHNKKHTGFLAIDSQTPNIYKVDENMNIGNNISTHISKNNKVYVTENFLVTYGKDCKVCIFKRTEHNFGLVQTIILECPCIAVQYLERMDIFIIAQRNSKLLLVGKKVDIQRAIPKSYLDEKLQDYYEDAIDFEDRLVFSPKNYDVIKQFRIRFPAYYLRAVQFSTACTMVICCSEPGSVDIIEMVAFPFKVKAFQVNLMDYPPLSGSPKIVCYRMFFEDLYKIKPAIDRTRAQFARDEKYLMQIRPEVQKRFILWRLNSTNSANIADIMLQCPYRRWISFLRTDKNKLTLYEFFNLIHEYNIIPSFFDTPEKFGDFIAEKINMKNGKQEGIHHCVSSLLFTKEDIIKALMCVIEIFHDQLNDYGASITETKKHDKNLQYLYFKSQINDFNSYTLHRFTEIENLVKNMIRSKKVSVQLTTKKVTKRVALPEIYPEPVLPLINWKNVHGPKLLCPDPLLQAFRYRSHREIKLQSNEIEYCSYDNETGAAEIIPSDELALPHEIGLSAALSFLNIGQRIYGVDKESKKILQNYPSGYVPLSYFLAANPFTCGSPQSFIVARYWLLQILVILGTLHKNKTVLRSCLPSNFLVSPDGSTIVLLSLADSYIEGEEIPPLHWEKTEECFLPPEHFSNKKPTPQFDVFQFGILLLILFTNLRPPSFAKVLKEHQKFRGIDGLSVAKLPSFFYDPLSGLDLSKFPHFTGSGEYLSSVMDIDSSFSLLNVAVACLDLDPERRPTIRQILDCPFFNLLPNHGLRAKTLSLSIVHSIPPSFFVNVVFGTLCSTIESELKLNPSYAPTLVTAVRIINEFINPGNDNIQFPIDANAFDKVVHEAFKQNFIAKIVNYVIKCLSRRFEIGEDVKSDDALSTMILLYQKFFESHLIKDNVVKYVYRSFKFLITGISPHRESHKLFTFIYSNMLPLVEFFFIRVSPDMHKFIGLSEFYCENFVVFYNNMRDIAMAFEEQSFRRYTSALEFMSTFIEAYPNDDTKQLLLDFGAAHKVEQALTFPSHAARLAAIELASKMLMLNDGSLFKDFVFTLFPYRLSSNVQPYPEKKRLVEITGDILTSNDICAIHSILKTQVFDSLIDCCSSSNQEYDKYFVWGYKEEEPIFKVGRNVVQEICDKGISLILAYIYCNESISSELIKKNYLSPIALTFEDLIYSLDNDIVDPKLISTLTVVAFSPTSIITSLTSQSESEFQNSLIKIALYLIRNNVNDINLLKTLLTIWEKHKWEIYVPLYEYIGKSFEKGRTDLIIYPILIHQNEPLPDCILSAPHIFAKLCNEKYEEIKNIVNKRTVDMNLISRYADERSWRIKMFKAMMKSNDKRLVNELQVKESFVDYVIKCLQTPVKLEVNLKVVPSSFAKYNRTYQIRNEAIDLIRVMTEFKSTGNDIFMHLLHKVLYDDVLLKEAELLRRIGDASYRKTCVRLLTVLSDAESEFHINEIIAKSDILMELKNENILGIENIQILKNAWEKKDEPEKWSLKREYCLYDSIK